MKRPWLALGLVIRVVVVLSVHVGGSAGTSVQEDLSGLSWLARSVARRDGPREHWTKAAGGMMLGVSRTVVGDKVVGFEFLRIEVRAEGVYYVAQPNGRAGTDFKLTKLEGESAMFETPEHDHPKIIRYQKGEDGSLTAQIEGDEGVQAFRFRPLAAITAP